MEAFKRKYKGRGTRNTDVQKDSKIPAKAVGKRVSKTGNTYYEYRDNRTDQRQPQPTNEPRLDVGGMIKREYDVNINSGVGTYAKGGEVESYVVIKGKKTKSFDSKESAKSYINKNGGEYAEIIDGRLKVYKDQVILAKGGKTDGDWIQGAVEEMKEKGTIGTFTKKAEKRGLTPVEFAKEVLDSNNSNKYTEKTRKQAQFVKNANPELFAFGGEIVRDYDVNINSGVGTYAKGGTIEDITKSIKDKYKGIPTIDRGNFSIEKSRRGGLNFVPDSYEQFAYENDEEPNEFGDSKILDKIENDVNKMYATGGNIMQDISPNANDGDGDIMPDASSMVNYARGGDILKAGDTDCPDELLNYAVGGRLNETMQGLKKGDTLKIKFGSAVSKDNVVTLRVKSRNKVRKGTIDKITFENLSNPKGVKFFAYDRGDGFSFAMGDLGISNIEILNKYKEGGKTQGYNAQLDESLGDRTGREELFEQKRKDRRDESKAMEEAMGRRAYASVRAMDKKKRTK